MTSQVIFSCSDAVCLWTSLYYQSRRFLSNPSAAVHWHCGWSSPANIAAPCNAFFLNRQRTTITMRRERGAGLTAVPYIKATTKVAWGWKQGVAGLKVCKYERLICLLNTISTNISGKLTLELWTHKEYSFSAAAVVSRSRWTMTVSEPTDLPNVTETAF